jgi:CheY-like chemotaxis protein
MVAPANGIQGDAPSILVVEDEELLTLHLTDMLEELGYAVAATASSGAAAIREATRLVAAPPALALVDISLKGGMDGVELAIELKRLGVPTLFLTGAWDPAINDRARPAAPLGHLEKPYTEASLRQALARALVRN